MSIETPGAPSASSPNAETETEVVVDANAETEASTTAESSNADETVVEPKSLLDVVKSAVEAPKAAESATVEGEGVEASAEAKEKPEGETQAEADEKLPFHQHPRWKEVLAERDGFREDAGRFRQMESYMQEHGLTAEEVGQGFTVMAQLKSGKSEDLAAAREYFATGLAALDAQLGNVLPDDLQERVDEGLVDVETAQELARTRAAEKLTKDRLEARDTRDAETRAADDAQKVANAMAEAVEGWEQRIKGNDPDYAKKATLVETTCRAIVQRDPAKTPKNAHEAVALVEEAYGQVNDILKSSLPKPKPVALAPRGSSATAVAQPKTLRDAVQAALTS